MTATSSASQTSTFSEARARAVMQHVLGDFMSVASAGLIERETIQKWHEDIEYAVVHNAVDTFQLQFMKPDGARCGLSYAVRDDGAIGEESKAGGFDPYGFPSGTRANLCLIYREGAANLDEVRAHLADRGWGSGGSLIDGITCRDRAFSKDGFGIARSKVGDWGDA